MQVLEKESTLWGSLCMNTAQGPQGDRERPFHISRSPHLQTPRLQAPLHSDALGPLSTRLCSLLGSVAFLVPSRAPSIPPGLHSCNPRPSGCISQPCLTEQPTVPQKAFPAARRLTTVEASPPTCHSRCPTQLTGALLLAMPRPQPSAQASIPLKTIPERMERPQW